MLPEHVRTFAGFGFARNATSHASIHVLLCGWRTGRCGRQLKASLLKGMQNIAMHCGNHKPVLALMHLMLHCSGYKPLPIPRRMSDDRFPRRPGERWIRHMCGRNAAASTSIGRRLESDQSIVTIMAKYTPLGGITAAEERAEISQSGSAKQCRRTGKARRL